MGGCINSEGSEWLDELVVGGNGGTEWKMNIYYMLTMNRFTSNVRLLTKKKETNIKLNLFGNGKTIF